MDRCGGEVEVRQGRGEVEVRQGRGGGEVEVRVGRGGGETGAGWRQELVIQSSLRWRKTAVWRRVETQDALGERGTDSRIRVFPVDFPS